MTCAPLQRFRPVEDKIFLYPPSALHPSQLYISEGKYNNVCEWFDPNDISCYDPIPMVELCGHMLMVDGYTRAVVAYLAGWKDVPVYFYTDELDAATYTKDILWCRQDHISSPIDLAMRIVSHNDYERLWRKDTWRCNFYVITPQTLGTSTSVRQCPTVFSNKESPHGLLPPLCSTRDSLVKCVCLAGAPGCDG